MKGKILHENTNANYKLIENRKIPHETLTEING